MCLFLILLVVYSGIRADVTPADHIQFKDRKGPFPEPFITGLIWGGHTFTHGFFPHFKLVNAPYFGDRHNGYGGPGFGRFRYVGNNLVGYISGGHGYRGHVFGGFWYGQPDHVFRGSGHGGLGFVGPGYEIYGYRIPGQGYGGYAYRGPGYGGHGYRRSGYLGHGYSDYSDYGWHGYGDHGYRGTGYGDSTYRGPGYVDNGYRTPSYNGGSDSDSGFEGRDDGVNSAAASSGQSDTPFHNTVASSGQGETPTPSINTAASNSFLDPSALSTGRVVQADVSSQRRSNLQAINGGQSRATTQRTGRGRLISRLGPYLNFATREGYYIKEYDNSGQNHGDSGYKGSGYNGASDSRRGIKAQGELSLQSRSNVQSVVGEQSGIPTQTTGRDRLVRRLGPYLNFQTREGYYIKVYGEKGYGDTGHRGQGYSGGRGSVLGSGQGIVNRSVQTSNLDGTSTLLFNTGTSINQGEAPIPFTNTGASDGFIRTSAAPSRVSNVKSAVGGQSMATAQTAGRGRLIRRLGPYLNFQTRKGYYIKEYENKSL